MLFFQNLSGILSIMSIPTMQLYVALALISVTLFIGMLKWNEVRYTRKGMPPGTMGWPFIGENAAFIKKGPDFMKERRSKFGNLFKTHALGSPIVISMDPNLNRYILMNEAKGLVPGYPDSMRNILGTNIAEVHGVVHKRIRGSLLSLVGPIAVRDHLLPEVNKFMKSFLDNWAGKTLDIQQKTIEMSFFVSMIAVVENEPSSFFESFKTTFDDMWFGTISLPIKIPGTSYFRGLKAKEKVVVLLKELLAKRRASSATHNDILDQLTRNEDVKYKLNDEEIIEQIVTILYAGFETVSTTTMMAVKYLCDNPRALQAIREEHFAIQHKKGPEELISWDDFKNMNFTRAVIFETMRLASVVCGVMRRTTTDVELNGFIIPKGWRVYAYTRETNFDPFLYSEPFSFNPWRWLESGLESHNHNMLFGAGGRVCPGKELGILKISLFLHYFVTKYRWEEVEGNKLVNFPRILAPEGLHMRIAKY